MERRRWSRSIIQWQDDDNSKMVSPLARRGFRWSEQVFEKSGFHIILMRRDGRSSLLGWWRNACKGGHEGRQKLGPGGRCRSAKAKGRKVGCRVPTCFLLIQNGGQGPYFALLFTLNIPRAPRLFRQSKFGRGFSHKFIRMT